jgi:hypothetical protein
MDDAEERFEMRLSWAYVHSKATFQRWDHICSVSTFVIHAYLIPIGFANADGTLPSETPTEVVVMARPSPPCMKS